MQKHMREYDVVVYGGNAAGIMAGVQASRMGMRVLAVEPSIRLGGLTTGGLGATDAGDPLAIGGLSREFYNRLGDYYGRPGPVWRFEPSAALRVLEDYIRESGIEVLTGRRLKERSGVVMDGTRIAALELESGEVCKAHIFIDATYEGDLMAWAGVSYTVGREGNGVYGEANNGIRLPAPLVPHVDPYRIPGVPESGLLDRVNPDPGGEMGDGDGKTQAYNYRMCLTDNPDNRVLVERPEGYREADYEILFRLLEQGYEGLVFKLTLMPGEKTDSNNTGSFSTDYIGMNHDYPEASYARRQEIAKAHEVYQKGLIWTLQHHPRVPEAVRRKHAPWGLPKDEFPESGHWPSQLYVREARRMRGEAVVTERMVKRLEAVDDSVGMGSYSMDSHCTQYCLDSAGRLCAEGGFMAGVPVPFPISYKTLVPRREECTNLLVPVCLSSSHAAYGSIRMEPVFMVLGQAAGTAAALAAQGGMSVQEVPYDRLRPLLDAQGLVVELDPDYITPPEVSGNPL